MAFVPKSYKYMMGPNFAKPSFSHTGFIGLVWVGVPPKDRVRIPMYVLRNKLNPCGAYTCMYVCDVCMYVRTNINWLGKSTYRYTRDDPTITASFVVPLPY